MITGHFAAGLALKPKSNTIPLWALLFAAQLTDVLGMIFVILGWEHMEPVPGISAINSMDMYLPYTHSLIMTPFWMGVGALMYKLYDRAASRRDMAIIAIAVASHWVLDFISHVPDLPIVLSRDPVVGLSLWNFPLGTQIVETVLLAIGVVVFLRAGSVVTLLNKCAFTSLAIILLGMALITNLPLPENGQDKALTALVLFVVIEAFALASEWRSKTN